MIKLPQYKNKLIGVVGLARSGAATIQALYESGAQIIAWDDNKEAMLKAKHELEKSGTILTIADSSNQIWKDVSLIIMSPGVPLRYPQEHPIYAIAKKFAIPINCDIELLSEASPQTPIIAVTGTNGKSTTTALIYHVLQMSGLQSELGGNIGIPVLQLPQLSSNNQFYVIEISSYQLDLINNARFKIAVCLSITPDHIDRHGNFALYMQAKERIFKNHSGTDVAIVSTEAYANAIIIDNLLAKGLKVIQISNTKILPEGISVVSGILHDNYSQIKAQYDVSNAPGLIGEHNGENMAAAFAACLSAGVNPMHIIAHFQNFKALPHRMQLFHSVANLNFINDSKATNADSAYWALKSFDKIHWIAGGISKDAGIVLLRPLLKKVAHAYLIGSSAEAFAKVLAANNVPFTITETLEETIKVIKAKNITQGNVLLSPACASFDQWKNYEERGNKFIQLVKECW